MNKDAKGARIQAIGLFRNATKKALDHLESAADEVTVSAGSTLIEQGHNHNEVLIIESGTAEVFVDGEAVAEIPAGEMLGELAALDPGPASATVRAKTDLELLVIPINRFAQILDDNPDMVRELAKELAARLRAADARLG